MASLQEQFQELGLRVPEILLPKPGIDLTRWAVIACDQHTSDRSYWNEVEATVGRAPSTLRLVLPEVYLADGNLEERIASVRETMNAYMENGVFSVHPETAVYVERTTGRGLVRKGIVIAVDLEAYNFSPESATLIRATEGTILERLPPRMHIRKGAPVELPHVMVLYDDPEHTIEGPLSRQRKAMTRLYDTDLMENGGHVTGYRIGETQLSSVAEGFQALIEPARLQRRYGSDRKLLFAVGDGNHSLASAKKVWEELKAAGAPSDHPARYALVELVNLFDDGLVFEPIHRIVTDTDPRHVIGGLKKLQGARWQPCADSAEVRREMSSAQNRKTAVGVITAEVHGVLFLRQEEGSMPASDIQLFLEDISESLPGTEVDYVHETETVMRLAGYRGAVGILLPEFDPSVLFRRVAQKGPLPRKVFSMGESAEKRYYLEARRILP